jgi:PAS domain S-box-containing protein
MISSLDDVLITNDLARRPARPANYAAENRALADLAEAMADSPQTILQKLVETALDLCRAHSAGISILEPNGASSMFRWHAIAGQFAKHVGRGMMREESPCGVVLDRDSSLLFSYPERHFNYGRAINPPIVEALLVPFHTEGKPVGTLWVIAHTPSLQFDAEDQRLLTSLSRFAAVAYQMKTALVTTDAGLKAKADEVRQMLGAAAIGLTHCSRDLRYLACNRAYEQLAGLSAEQIIGRPIIDVIGTEAFEVIRPYVERVLGGERVEYEEEVLDSTSGPRFFHVVYEPWFDSEGQVTGWIATVSDVTGLKLATAALLEREQRLRLVLDASGAASWIREARTGRADWDDRFRKLYGFTAEEPASFEAWLSRVHEEDRLHVLELVDDICHTKTLDTFDTTFRIVRPDGTVSWIESLGHVDRDAEGQVTRLTGLELDITERRRNEEALHSREARMREFLEIALRRADSELRTILKAAPIGIVTMDREGKVTNWNDAAERIFGYRADEVVGRINPAIPDDALAGFRESISRVMKGATIQTEGQQIRKDRSVIYVSLVRAPHYDEHGTVKGAITLVEDITAKRKAENDLARVRSALAEVQIEESRRIARELHDDIGQRLALLSFDMESMASRPPVSRNELVMNLRACQRNILDISEGLRQISHRMHPSVLEHLGLNRALDHLCREFSKREGIPVKFHSEEFPSDIPRSIGACFYRVAQEALRNVSKHAKALDVEVKLGVVGEALQLCIIDSGTGFDTSAVQSGLGLHSMRERSELASGTFSVTSEIGRGTGIVVSIPLHESYSRPIQSVGNDVGRPDEQIKPDTKKRRVLIGDDHPLFASGVANLLQETYEVVGVVADGLALVRAAEQLNPDLVLLDISMPIMNGFDAARQIRKSVPGSKLLFLTTYSSPAYVEEAFKSGADGYLVKHAAPAELPVAIATVLRGEQYRSPQIGKQSRGTA